MALSSILVPDGDSGDFDPVPVDVIATIEYPVYKLGLGAEGAVTLLDIGQQAAAASLPVVLASDQSALAVTGPLTDAELRASAITVEDDYTGLDPHHQTLTASTSTEITFTSAGRAFRVVNWSTDARVLVKSSAITDGDDSAAARVGIAPKADVPNVRVFPYAASSVFIYSTAAAEVTVEVFT